MVLKQFITLLQSILIFVTLVVNPVCLEDAVMYLVYIYIIEL